MRTSTRQGIQVLRGVREFLAATNVTPALGSVTKPVTALAETNDRLAAHAAAQETSARAFQVEARNARQLARVLRVEYLRPLARLGKVLFPENAPALTALRMPRAKGYQGLIAVGQAIADGAEPHREQFVEAGFEPDFVERVRSAVDALRKQLDLKTTQYGLRTAATAGLGHEFGRGRDLVRLLDPMVAPRLESTPERLAQWRTLSRFVRSASLVNGVADVPAVTPPVGTPPAVPVESGAVPLDRAA